MYQLIDQVENLWFSAQTTAIDIQSSSDGDKNT